jgi:hypothetical protein
MPLLAGKAGSSGWEECFARREDSSGGGEVKHVFPAWHVNYVSLGALMLRPTSQIEEDRRVQLCHQK